MERRKRKGAVVERKKEVLMSLRALGLKIYEQMDNGLFPSIEMPSRSIENIRYDPQLGQFVLGNRKVKRSASNIRHLKPFTQLTWAALFSHELTSQRKTSTLRDVYYSAQAYDVAFTDQQESNNIITDLETILGFSREDFNIFPEERSAVFGDLTIEYTVPGYEGRRLNLTSHPDGVMIGPALTSAEFIKTAADKVIAIEKGGLFTRFIEENVHRKFNAILVLTAGQAPRATRHFIRRLNEELDLPVYVFSVDADENVMINKDGLLRVVRIGEYVDSKIRENGSTNPYVLPGYERCRINGEKTVTVLSDGDVSEGEVVCGIRHPITSDLYDITLKGGYNVRVTGSHSVMVYDDYGFKPKPVSNLSQSDLLAVCFNVPNRTNLTKVNVAELILSEAPELAGRILVNWGYDGVKASYLEDLRRWKYAKHKATSISELTEKGMVPRKGWLKLSKSKIAIPVNLAMTPELMRLLGYYVANGGFSRAGVKLSFSSGWPYVEDVLHCIKSLLSCPIQVREGKRRTLILFGGKLLQFLFKDVLAIGENDNGRAVPFIVFNVPTALKIHFLLGYYRSNGHLRRGWNGCKASLITETASRKLASDLVLLLIQLGALPYVERRKLKRTGRKGTESYAIVLKDGRSLKRLKKVVEDLDPSAIQMLKRVKKSPTWFSVPKEVVWQALDSLKKHAKPQCRDDLENFIQREVSSRKRISLRKLSKALNYLVDRAQDRKILFLTRLLRNKVLLLPVTKIQKVRPTTGYAYDVQVTGGSTFLGGLGPILLHNTDGDPWGMHIAMVIISGSANAAHLRDLTTPSAKWSGVWATDIINYRLPTDPLDEVDVKRLYELQRDPRYKDPLWQREIKTFLKIRRKAEQEAFSKYGLTYIVDEYLPAKLEEASKFSSPHH